MIINIIAMKRLLYMNVEKTVIIIPSYNEALVIEETLIAVLDATSNIPNMLVEILVFDSASHDATQDIVSQLQNQYPRLFLQTESKKSGLGSAYLQAMRYALNEMQADIIIEFDADLSHQPQYLAPILQKIQNQDVVIGSRYVPGGSIPKDWAWHRKCLSILGNYLARLVLSKKYKDFTSGFRASRRAYLEQVLPDAFISNHYAYKLELLWALHQAKAKIAEYPIHFIDRKKGCSKLPSNSILDALRVLFILRFRSLKKYLNMCIVGFLGMLVQLIVYNVLRVYLLPFTALKLAVLSAILSNFTLNHRFTFKKSLIKKTSQLKSASTFIAYSLFMIGIQSYWLQLGIKYLSASTINENLIMASGIILGSIINYFTYTRFIWPQKKQPLTPGLY